MEDKSKSLELWSFRRMLRVSWLDRQSNEIVLDRDGVHRCQINVIIKRQIQVANVYFGHICSKGKLENLVSTGNIEGKRARGRQRQGYMASMKRRMGQSWSGYKNIIQHTKDKGI